MDPGEDIDLDFERQLRQIELRRPPAEWKALLLPVTAPVWFSKPLLAGLVVCWGATAALILTTPEEGPPQPPVTLPVEPPPGEGILLGLQRFEIPSS